MQSEHFPFIYCIESLVYQGNYTQWETCFEKLGLDPNPVANCYNSGRGKEVSFFCVFIHQCMFIYFDVFNLMVDVKLYGFQTFRLQVYYYLISATK